ncbi:hypothetical protein [Catellatospora methionotrophica]|uniref:hypothetical protein n=1 Tax=Catellatospora methionotrophica TaxID=121620 RepID=UPI001408EDD8|nr:hypothetical protein [Catellatospora methionotrophica]
MLERIPEDRRVRIDQYLSAAEQRLARRSDDDRIVRRLIDRISAVVPGAALSGLHMGAVACR